MNKIWMIFLPVPRPRLTSAGQPYLWIVAVLTSLFLSGCISVSSATATPTLLAQFVTSTLPPTKALVLPSTVTPETPVATVATGTPATQAPTAPPDCKVQAVLLEDVTIPDNTRMPAGEPFTKTWRFKNTGTCHWTGYTIDFLTGDRMEAPDSASIPDTLAGSTVDVSLELTAPTTDGSYSGYFTLKDAEGESINVGAEKTFWLKIIVGDPTTVPTASSGGSSNSGGTSGNTTTSLSNCDFSGNAGYASQIESLINAERQKNGLPTLAINASLTTAAQNHAADMACNSMLSHTGSDGSYVNTRVVRAGYSPSYSEEIIYAGGGPQVAFDWWMSDKLHRDAILSNKSAEIGIGYAYVSSSAYGGYFTVDFASP
ncbi:MAG: NBR1-Ig-like domain-containing protein [Anaerolineales bacterium]